MKKFIALFLCVAMLLSITACGGSKPAASAAAPAAPAASAAAPAASAAAPKFEKMTWKFACSATETSTWVQAGKKFGEIVADKTGGAVTVEYYPADQLTGGNQKEGIQALMDGTTELSMHSNLIYSGFDQRFNVVSLPFLFATTADADAKLDGEGGKALAKVLEEKGLHFLGTAENGFRHVTNSKKEIKTPADMKDLKIRVAGSALLNKSYELWGADYANANWSEVFTALQTGTYDGQENPLPTADAASIQEVQKYCTYWTGAYDCLFFCMNNDLYKSLSPELQAIVDEAGLEACRYQRELNRAEDEKVIKKWEDAGVTIHRLTEAEAAEFKKLSDPVYKEFEKDLTPELIAAFTK